MKDRVTNNRAVPMETVWRNAYKSACVEIGMLKSEIEELKDTLARRDKAINDFKKWQEKVRRNTIDFWKSEAMKLADDVPEQEEVQSIFQFLERRQAFLKRIHRLESAYRKMASEAEIMKKIKERRLQQQKQ